MSNVVPFSNRRQALEHKQQQACVWLVKLDAGASEEELRDLSAWLGEDPEHPRILLEVAGMWDQVSVLAELSEIFPLGQYVKARPGKPGRRKLVAALAATLSVAMIGGGLAGKNLDSWRTLFGAGGNKPRRYETRVGEQSTVVLADSSEIILNTNTLVEVLYREAERRVSLLRGEAHFSVAKDSLRPFRVYAGANVVEATGTAFAVQRMQEGGMEVTVTEGAVNVSHNPGADVVEPASETPTREPVAAAQPMGPLSLSAGESARVSEQNVATEKRRMQPMEIEGRLAWRHGMLLFQGDTLEQAIKEVSRYTSIHIEMDDAVKDIQVVGYFRTGDIDPLLRTMEETFQVNVQRIDDDHIYLSYK